MGHLIPAGTGFHNSRHIGVIENVTAEEIAAQEAAEKAAEEGSEEGDDGEEGEEVAPKASIEDILSGSAEL